MAGAARPSDGRLAAILSELWAAVGVPDKERRWLGGAAVARELAWRLQAPAAPAPCIELETLLDGIRQGAGLSSKPGIAEAKRTLRRLGLAGVERQAGECQGLAAGALQARRHQRPRHPGQV